MQHPWRSNIIAPDAPALKRADVPEAVALLVLMMPLEGLEPTTIVLSLNILSKGLDRRDVIRLQADAPVKNTGKTRYNS